MEFYSPLFLFAFLPICLLAYHLIPGQRGKNALLITASLLFYAFGSIRDLALLLGSALLHYLAGLMLLHREKLRKPLAVIMVCINVALLTACKLSGYLPLGVSFFTFQAISYVVDACRDPQNASRSFREVLQYITFFPQLVSGPLMKFSQARLFLNNRTVSAQETACGIRRFVLGLGKKLLLSAAVAGLANAVFALTPDQLDIRTAWLGAVCYSLQLYFDFSGYSDMAIGLGGILGYTLPENFRYPYAASSVSNFWRRWHISLSGWFRDYVYIPLGGSRSGKARTLINKLIVFLATGLWHGVSMTYLLWGLWHGLWCAVETAWQLPKKLEKRWYGHAYTMLVVLLGFVLFRASSVGQAIAIAAQMFTGFSLTAASSTVLAHTLSMRAVCMLALSCVLCLPVGQLLHEKCSSRRGYETAANLATLALLILCILALASGSFQPFIYQQF